MQTITLNQLPTAIARILTIQYPTINGNPYAYTRDFKNSLPVQDLYSELESLINANTPKIYIAIFDDMALLKLVAPIEIESDPELLEYYQPNLQINNTTIALALS